MLPWNDTRTTPIYLLPYRQHRHGDTPLPGSNPWSSSLADNACRFHIVQYGQPTSIVSAIDIVALSYERRNLSMVMLTGPVSASRILYCLIRIGPGTCLPSKA